MKAEGWYFIFRDGHPALDANPIHGRNTLKIKYQPSAFINTTKLFFIFFPIEVWHHLSNGTRWMGYTVWSAEAIC
jgi:hypothetical protein